MVDYETVIATIDEPKYKDKDIIDVQDTQDIINDLIYCFKKYNEQAKPVANKFSTGNIEGDSKRIYDFIKYNIKYEAEPEKYQTTRSFSRIVHDKFGDCKHSALLASSIGWNLGYNIIFRFVSYDRGSTYGHVYTLIENPRTGKSVVIDPLQPFNTEKKFYKYKDYKAKINSNFNPMLSRLTGLPGTSADTMAGKKLFRGNRTGRGLRTRAAFKNKLLNPDETRVQVGAMEVIMSPSISGSEADTLDGLCGIGRRSRAERKQHRAEAKTARKEQRAEQKKAGAGKRGKEKRQAKREARGGRRFKKFHLAPIRHAFSTLLNFNTRGLASGLAEALQKDEGKVRKFASKLAYNFEILKRQILNGAKKAPLLGSRIGIIGAAPAVAAPLVVGAPAILLALTLFKALNIGGKNKTGVSDEAAMQEAVKDIASGGVNMSEGSGGGGGSSEGGGGSSEGGGGGSNNAAKSSEGGGNDPGSGGGGGFMETINNIPTPVKVIGVLGLAYLANKKFKFI